MALYGKYEAVAELGRGGMGVVYRGRAIDSGANVAIKVVSSIDPMDLDRFERERRLLANFNAEDGFVPLLDAGVAGGRPYVVMPLLEGGTLSDRLRRGPLPVAEAVALVRRLARALRGAHERGIIHRDLKPSNVLFDRDGNAFVADLGLAKHFRRDVPGGGKSQSLTETGASTGTLGYMAPEQLGDAKTVSPRADVFALGAILHECLSGS
ncbi:MAG TPA: serine/threonine-protein kinase, partial [Planctomycetota bacterium]|nr:serine/threonine-protein kinase [Planctomycetota bacterium]